MIDLRGGQRMDDKHTETYDKYLRNQHPDIAQWKDKDSNHYIKAAIAKRIGPISRSASQPMVKADKIPTLYPR